MKYISLGAVMEPSTEHIVKVSHCGIDYTLTQELASLWLDGRFGFAEAESPIEMRALMVNVPLLLKQLDMQSKSNVSENISEE